MAIAEITSALTGIKIAKDLIKGISSPNSKIEIKSKSSELLSIIVDLQEQILSMQSKYGELLQSKNNLENELMGIKKWEEEKLQYELKEFCPGVFVYASKFNNDPSQPSHWLCQNCYNNNKKSIIQRKYQSVYICHSCNAEIYDHSKKISIPKRKAPSYFKGR